MTIRHGLLALLRTGPMHREGLRAALEARTGAVWSINSGQVHTTLARLHRDGLIEIVDDVDRTGATLFQITSTGREDSDAWFAAAVDPATPPRNELAIKIALTSNACAVDVLAVVQAERLAAKQALEQLRQRRLEADGGSHAARGRLESLLCLDASIFKLTGEIRWLDQLPALLRIRE
jgi:DNA-binding PadR family transcriptional regulator